MGHDLSISCHFQAGLARTGTKAQGLHVDQTIAALPENETASPATPKAGNTLAQ